MTEEKKKLSMNRVVRAFLRISVLILLAPCAAHADFQCADAMSSPERLICSDPALVGLDSDLNTAYDALFALTNNRAALRAQQRRWLKTARNRCETATCMALAYKNRINALSMQLIEQGSIVEGPMSNHDAKRVCNELAQLGNEGRLASWQFPGAINGKLMLRKRMVDGLWRPKSWQRSRRELTPSLRLCRVAKLDRSADGSIKVTP